MAQAQIRGPRGRQDRAREGDPAADALAALRGGGAGLARRGTRRPRSRPASASRAATAATRSSWPIPEIDAVYNPLPNHLHVPWTIKAAEAGKHVLCEKPIGLDAAECAELIAVRDRTGVRIQEAFMVRTHPQWLQGARAGAERADRRAEGDPRPFQLPPDRPHQRAQRGRMGRRRAARHRLLPDHHLALRHRAGAAAGGGDHRARPRQTASTGWARPSSTMARSSAASSTAPRWCRARPCSSTAPRRGWWSRSASTRPTTCPAG